MILASEWLTLARAADEVKEKGDMEGTTQWLAEAKDHRNQAVCNGNKSTSRMTLKAPSSQKTDKFMYQFTVKDTPYFPNF